MAIDNLLNGIVGLVGASAIIAIIVTAFGLMLGILKPANATGRIGIIAGTVIALLVLPEIIVNIWRTLPLWQHLGLIVLLVAIAAVALDRGHRRPKGRKSNQ